jgi:hypothetical protein
LNTTETGSVHAVIRHIGPSPRNEYDYWENRLTVRAVRTIEGAWNVIIDQDTASDGGRDGITLNAVGARELARLLLNAADSESSGSRARWSSRIAA